jgi:hypothetical protein
MAKSIPNQLKEKFGYTVSDLTAYVDEQNPDIVGKLTEGAFFMARCNIMTGVKGSEKIKLFTDNLVMQSADTCGWNASGGITFTDKTISNERMKFQEEYCNETLNGKWTQLRNRIGANVQDLENPFADIMIAGKLAELHTAIQKLLILGDTTSGDSQLAFFDGLVKKLEADANVVTYTTTETSITDSNAFAILRGLSRAIPSVLFSNNVETEIVCGLETAQKCIDNIWNSKDYNALLEFSRNEAGELYFTLPTTTTVVRVLPELNGTEKAFALPYQYISVAVDGDKDEDGIEIKYNDNDEKLRVGSKWRLGIEYIMSEYFVKLALT